MDFTNIPTIHLLSGVSFGADFLFIRGRRGVHETIDTANPPLPGASESFHYGPRHYQCREIWLSDMMRKTRGLGLPEATTIPSEPGPTTPSWMNEYTLVTTLSYLHGPCALAGFDTDEYKSSIQGRAHLLWLALIFIAPFLDGVGGTSVRRFVQAMEIFKAQNEMYLSQKKFPRTITNFYPGWIGPAGYERMKKLGVAEINPLLYADYATNPCSGSGSYNPDMYERYRIILPNAISQHPAFLHFALGIIRSVMCYYVGPDQIASAGRLLSRIDKAVGGLTLEKVFTPGLMLDVLRHQIKPSVWKAEEAYVSTHFREIGHLKHLFTVYDALPAVWDRIRETMVGWMCPRNQDRPMGFGVFAANANMLTPVKSGNVEVLIANQRGNAPSLTNFNDDDAGADEDDDIDPDEVEDDLES